AKKIDINAENLSRRYNGGSISRDNLVKRRPNRIQERAVPPKSSSTSAPKAQGGNPSNSVKNTDGKLINDKSPDISSGGQPVDTGPSPSALIAVGAVCAVCLVVAGIFTVVNRRKRQELTDSIVATSAVAWEQQDIEESKEEETLQPIVGYTNR
ncbi:9940_t:CDS:2, partial [Racocetra fulgida]